MKKSFEAKIKSDRLTFIDLPFNASEVFKSKGKINVVGKINGHEFKKSLLSRGNGRYIITLNKRMMKEFSLNIGDTVEIIMELDSGDNDTLIKEDNEVAKYYQSTREKMKSNKALNIFEAIFTRRSVRNFTGNIIKDSDLKTIIKAGFYAPSAENKQPWHFIVIKEKDTLKKISKFHSKARMLPKAGCGIIVCGDKEKQSQTGFLIEDCSAATENMLLCAHGLGLGSVWCGLYPATNLTKPIKELLRLPKNIVPVALVVVGYTEENKDMVLRYRKERIHMEKW